MGSRLLSDLYVYAMGSMIYVDIVLVAFIVMFAAFGSGSWQPR